MAVVQSTPAAFEYALEAVKKVSQVLLGGKKTDLDLPALVAGLVSATVTLKLLRTFSMKLPSSVFVPPTESSSLLSWISGHASEISRGSAFSWHTQVAAKLPRYHLFGHRMFTLPRVVVTHPSDVEYILRSGGKHFEKSPIYKVFGKIIGDGILTRVNDDEHWVQRKEMGSAFSPLALKRIADITVTNQIKTMLAELKDVAHRADNRLEFNPMIANITLRVIAEAAFATSKEVVDKVSTAFIDTLGAFTVWAFLPGYMSLPTSRNRSLKKNRGTIDSLVQGSIKQTLTRGKPAIGEGRTLADYLVYSKLLTSRDVSENSLTIMFAGHETTATALTWIIYALAKHPEIQEKLYEELCSVVAKNTTTSLDELKGCRYLHAVINEGLRVFPPAPQVSRMARSDLVLPGTKSFLPKGANVEVNVYLVHRDTSVWGSDAEEFRPERWEDPATMDKLTETSWIPFIIGRRNCIGKDFAMNELVLLLAALVRNFRWEWPADEPEVVRRHQLVLRAERNYRVCVVERES